VNYAYRIGYALLNIDHMTEKAGIAGQILAAAGGLKR
jgi:hypothetical protein